MSRLYKPKLASLNESSKNVSFLPSPVCCLNTMIQQIVSATVKNGFQVILQKLLSQIQKNNMDFIFKELKILNIKSFILEKQNGIVFRDEVIDDDVMKAQSFNIFVTTVFPISDT